MSYWLQKKKKKKKKKFFLEKISNKIYSFKFYLYITKQFYFFG